MVATKDQRLIVRFGDPAEAGPRTALLVEEGAHAGVVALPARMVERFKVAASLSAHSAGCTCCAPRSPVAAALARLFIARARGEVPLFDEVVAVTHSPPGEAAVQTALIGDVVTRARFRLVPDSRELMGVS